MPKFNSIDLLTQVTDETTQLIQEVKVFQQLNNQQLTWKPNEKTWSINDCLDHLNSVNSYYLKQLKKAVELNKLPAQETFKSGFFGNIMVKNMKPVFEENKEVKIPMKMKTLGDLQPKQQNTDNVFTNFLEQQNQFLSFLEKAKTMNLTKNNISSMVGSILQFRLGDCFLFIVAHNQRHIEQAKNIQKQFPHS